MIVLKRILVPTDFSDTSEVALKYAVALGEAMGAAVHVLYVLENPLSYTWGAEAYVPPPADFYDRLEQGARERLDKAMPPDQRARIGAVLDLRTGSPFVEILKYAKEQQIDLIVMGTHGRGAVAHMLLGSVAEKVVRKAPCPVLTVRHPQHEFVMP